MTPHQKLNDQLSQSLADFSPKIIDAVGELTVEVKAAHYHDALKKLRDEPALGFDTLIDLCGVDYSEYRDGTWDGPRYASVLHLLSVSNNWRVRVRSFCADDDFPVLPTVTDLWTVADWFERESFDLFGIIYENHADLRRILTDYGFVGHPFRKDFPITGHVEMRYDPEQKRVVYQPVTIEPREIVPRVIREEGYGSNG